MREAVARSAKVAGKPRLFLNSPFIHFDTLSDSVLVSHLYLLIFRKSSNDTMSKDAVLSAEVLQVSRECLLSS